MDSTKETESGTGLLHPSAIDFETLVNLSSEAIAVIALDGTLTFASPAAERLFGWSKDKLAGQLSDLVYLSAADPDGELMHRILSGGATPDIPLPHADLQFRSAYGPMVWAEATAHLLVDTTSTPYAFAVYFQNIAKRKDLENRLEAATQTDALTGLFNRGAFEDSLRREWAIAVREKTHTGLIKVSLDKFEALSERYDPGIAEECLTKVAETLKETARRPADVVARTGKSEFSLLLPRTHEMGVETISAYIHVAIQDLALPNPDNKAGSGVETASVGAACAIVEKAGVSESFETILAAAENCVFQARQEGGNRVKTVTKHIG